MRRCALLLVVAAMALTSGAGCCRCCRCGPRDDRLPPPDVPREERIPPGVLRGEGTPASLPKPTGEPRPTGAYGGS